jgi:hypothetical protein
MLEWHVPSPSRRFRAKLGDKVHVVVVVVVAKVPILEAFRKPTTYPVAVAPVMPRGFSQLVAGVVQVQVPSRIAGGFVPSERIVVVLGDNARRFVAGNQRPEYR